MPERSILPLCSAALHNTDELRSNPELADLRAPLSQVMRLMVENQVVVKSDANWRIEESAYAKVHGEVYNKLKCHVADAARLLVDAAPKELQEQLKPFQPSFRTAEKLSIELCQRHPDKLFVYEDTLTQKAKDGQAVIRDAPNAVGIPTQRSPGGEFKHKLSDQDFERVRQAMDPSVQRLRQHLADGGQVVWPVEEVGTGPAQVSTHAPTIHQHMQRVQRSLDPDHRHTFTVIIPPETPDPVSHKITQITLGLARLSPDLQKNEWSLSMSRNSPQEYVLSEIDDLRVMYEGSISIGMSRAAPIALVEIFQKNVRKDQPFDTMIEQKLQTATTDWAQKNPGVAHTPNLARALLGQDMDNPEKRKLATKALDLIRQSHSDPSTLSQDEVYRRMRDGRAILSSDLKSPVEVVLCWTKDGTGGGSMAPFHKLAQDQGIRIVDVGHPAFADKTPEHIIAVVKDPQLHPSREDLRAARAKHSKDFVL